MTSIGIPNAFHKDSRVWVDLTSPLDSFGLRGLMITDPVGIRPPNCIIAFVPPFDEQLATHVSLLFNNTNSYEHPLVLPQLMQR
jgi:hypothetical protein